MKNNVNYKVRPSRRRFLCGVGGVLLSSVCEAKAMRIVLNVVIFNYLDRPIFDVQIDGKVNAVSGAYPATGKSNNVGIELLLGPKTVTWTLDGPDGMPRNGDIVRNKNQLELVNVVAVAKYLSVHIYRDDTVELVTSVHFPVVSPRGELESSKLDKNHGR